MKQYLITKDAEWGHFIKIIEQDGDLEESTQPGLILSEYQLWMLMCELKNKLGWHPNYRKGDVVVCINDSGNGQEKEGEVSTAIVSGLNHGRKYTVSRDSWPTSGGTESVNLVGVKYGWGVDRFKIVTQKDIK